MRGALLVPACASTALLAFGLAVSQPLSVTQIPILLLCEFTFSGFWILFLSRTLVRSGDPVPSLLSSRAAALFVAAAALIALLASALQSIGAATESLIELGFYTGLGLAVYGLVLLDQVVRNTRADSAWSHKFLWIAVGGILFSNFILYAGAAALRTFPSGVWDSRGVIWALCAPILAVGISRIKAWSPNRFLAPNLVFYTSALTLAGFCLIVIAAATYYARLFGGAWGDAIEVVVLVGGLLSMVLAFSSGQVRGRVRVMLSKNFLPYKYDYRHEWQRLVDTIARRTALQSLPDRAVQAMASLVRSSTGGLWIHRGGGELIPAGGDYATPAMASITDAEAFISFLEAREWIVDLDVERSSRPTAGLNVPDVLLSLSRARFIVPLLQGDQLVAVMVIGNPPAPQPLSWEDLDLLRAAARQVASFIALEQSSAELAEAKQFEAYNRLAAFLMHDLKNLIAQLSLVVENAARHKHNPEFIDDAIDTIDNSVKRMQRVLDQLRRGDVSGALRRTDVDPVCHEVADRCRDRLPLPVIILHDSGIKVMVNAERFSMVLEHVVRNAQEACDPDGEVVVEVRRTSNEVEICVRDTGIGMDASFVRDRLFRPFDTTKGSAGMGIGAYQVREYVRSMGGSVTVRSSRGVGTRFSIHLPLAPSDGGP